MKRIAWGTALALVAAGFVVAPSAHAAPVNDQSSQAATATLNANNEFTVPLSNVGATLEPGEVDRVCGAPIGKSVWWRFVAPQAMTISVDTLGSGFDTVLGVYQSTANVRRPAEPHTSDLGNLRLDALACSDDTQEAGDPRSSKIGSLSLNNGATYFIQVAGWGADANAASGSGTLRVRRINLPGTIAGVITQSGGSALDNMCVEVADVSGGVINEVRTDATGLYLHPDLPASDYKIRAHDCNRRTHEARWYKAGVPGGVANAADASAITVDEDEDETGISIALPKLPDIPKNNDRVFAEKVSVLGGPAFSLNTLLATTEGRTGFKESEPVPDEACQGEAHGTGELNAGIFRTAWYRFRPVQDEPVTVTATATETAFPVFIAVYREHSLLGTTEHVGCIAGTGATTVLSNVGLLKDNTYFIQVGSTVDTGGALSVAFTRHAAS